MTAAYTARPGQQSHRGCSCAATGRCGVCQQFLRAALAVSVAMRALRALRQSATTSRQPREMATA